MRRRSLAAAAALALVAVGAPWSAAQAAASAEATGYELDPRFTVVRTPVVAGGGIDVVDALAGSSGGTDVVTVMRTGSGSAVVRDDRVTTYPDVMARAAAMAPDGSVVIAGDDGAALAATTTVVRTRADGSVVSRSDEPSVYGALYTQTVDAVALLPTGDAVVVGTAAGYLALYRFTPAGELRATAVQPMGSGLRVRSAVAVTDGSGSGVFVGGSVGDDALVARFGADGDLVWSATVAGAGEAGDLVAGDGSIVAGVSKAFGYSLLRFAAGDGGRDAGFGNVAMTLPAPARVHNVEADRSGGFVVSGAGGLAGQGGRAAIAIARFDDDGAPSGEVDAIDAVPLQHERGRALFAGSDLVLVGEAGNDGNGDELFVAKLRASSSASPPPPSSVPPVTTSAVDGYWMLDASGAAHAFGDAVWHGNAPATASAPAVDVEATPGGRGYWIVDRAGRVSTNGDARSFVARGALELGAGEIVSAMASTPGGDGYWLFTSLGRVIARGAAVHFGDMSGVALNAAVVDAITTPAGDGYWLVAADGGIFTFGAARFAGSTGDLQLNEPVQSLVPDGDGDGYWLVASDGGVFSFAAPFHGSLGSLKLNRPITGMVGSADGRGYLMVAEDGGVFAFGDAPFFGSLGDSPPSSPVVAITTR